MKLEGQISPVELSESHDGAAEHVSLANLQEVALAILCGLDVEVLEVQVELLSVAVALQIVDAALVVGVVVWVVWAGDLVLVAPVVAAALAGTRGRDEQAEDQDRRKHDAAWLVERARLSGGVRDGFGTICP